MAKLTNNNSAHLSDILDQVSDVILRRDESVFDAFAPAMDAAQSGYESDDANQVVEGLCLLIGAFILLVDGTLVCEVSDAPAGEQDEVSKEGEPA